MMKKQSQPSLSHSGNLGFLAVLKFMLPPWSKVPAHVHPPGRGHMKRRCLRDANTGSGSPRSHVCLMRPIPVLQLRETLTLAIHIMAERAHWSQSRKETLKGR